MVDGQSTPGILGLMVQALTPPTCSIITIKKCIAHSPVRADPLRDPRDPDPILKNKIKIQQPPKKPDPDIAFFIRKTRIRIRHDKITATLDYLIKAFEKG